MGREINITVVQLGPLDLDKEKNLRVILDAMDEAATQSPDFVVFPELATTPFFSIGLKKSEFFDLAETVPGPTTELVGAKAREMESAVVLPLFERGPIEGQYYNSAVVIGPDGNVIPGVLPDGEAIPAYRKNFISEYRWPTGENDEKYYFSPGPGYPIFDTPKGRVGVLVCYDRWFPEGYRVLALRGAEMVFVPVASAGFVGDLFVAGLRTHAAENAFAVVGCNKAGTEVVGDKSASYYGLSCIVGPNGAVVAQAKDGESDMIHGTVDLDEIRDIRRRLFVYRDRRPELCRILSQ